MFIAFEGLDGSGSSTQSRILAEKFEAKGHKVLLTKEPTKDTPTGKLIREVLRHKREATPEGLQFLFSADRADHLKREIEPALANGKVVITDRYMFSAIAYGALDIEDIDWLKNLGKRFRVPDITFLFKLDPAVCIERITGRGNEFELFEEKGKLQKIWKNYEKIAQDFPGIYIVNADRSIKEIAGEIWGIVEEKI